jgi:glucose-1-phosphate thymidylyltransferase
MEASGALREHVGDQAMVGLIPAAGRATRLGRIPCSKEIYPVGYETQGDGSGRPVTCSERLIHAFRRAGADRTFVVLGDGKWDIPRYLADGHHFGVRLAYVMARLPFGQPFTADAAGPFIRGFTVLFGFPDILFEPKDAFVRLLAEQRTTGADVVLGLFPTDRPEKSDMVMVDDAGAVRKILIKPDATKLTHTWILAVWAPTFTGFLRSFVVQALEADPSGRPGGRELFMGDVFEAGLGEGMCIRAVTFDEGAYTDIGTPEELKDVMDGGAGAAGAAPPRHGSCQSGPGA